MRKIRFPAKHFKVIKNCICLILAMVLLVTSVSSVVSAADDASGEAVNVTMPAEEEKTEEASEATETEDPTETEKPTEVSEPTETEDPETDNEQEINADTGEQEQAETEAGEEVQEVTYDPQPETMEEVRAAIDAYTAEYQKVLAESGFLAALKVSKPHWQYEVSEEIMPNGYNCQLVTDDEDFGAEYYTFFAGVTAVSGAWDGNPGTSFEGGAGTESDPYKISNGAQLAYLAQQVNAGTTYEGFCFELTDDIDLNNKNWTPIGKATVDLVNANTTATFNDFQNNKVPFKGTLDGKGKTILNLSINTTSAFQGIFGCVEGAAISNLTVNGSVRGGSYTGMLAGLALDGTTIYNCDTVSAAVTGAGGGSALIYGRYVGGLVGCAAVVTDKGDVLIEKCESAAAVTLSGSYGQYGGGLVGYSYFLYISVATHQGISGGKISVNGCAASGDVKSTSTNGEGLGGLIGGGDIYGVGNALAIRESSATGAVSTEGMYGFQVGGLLGYSRVRGGRGAVVDISGCSASGDIRTTGMYGRAAGGLIGQHYDYMGENTTLTISDSHAAGSVTTTGQHGNSASALIGWLYPYMTKGAKIDISGSTAKGDVTTSGADGHYVGGLIGHNLIGTTTNTSIAISDCSVSGDVNTKNGGYYVGGLIGYNALYEGSGTTMEMSGCSYEGTVRSANDGTRTNAGYMVGGLIGYGYISGNNQTLDISDSNTSGTIRSDANYGYHVGGLIGYHAIGAPGETPRDISLTISGCYSNADVITTGKDGHDVGGIIGYNALYGQNHTVDISESYATGNITTSGEHGYHVGGVIGYSYVSGSGNTLTTDQCHATGDISTSGRAAFYAGGFIGYSYIDSGSTSNPNRIEISRCYAEGDVTTAGKDAYYAGGFIGFYSDPGVTSQSEIIDCYATGDVVTNSHSAGGFIGYLYYVAYSNAVTSGRIKNCYAAGNVRANNIDKIVTQLGGTGGFIGFNDGMSMIDCYAIGKVSASMNPVGGLIGSLYSEGAQSGREIKNCYATGTVTNEAAGGSFNNTGGFTGRICSTATQAFIKFNNCYFDTTTTGITTAVGAGTGYNSSHNNITGLMTEKMIDIGTFASASWGIRNNIGGQAGGAGTGASPWYIDDDVTYPYLYYQYDGHSKAETNYNIKVAKWNNTVAIYDRTDFNNISGTGQFKVATAGAARMYFPYADGKNIFDTAEISVPPSAFNSSGYSLYSLGSRSATDIVAFTNMPSAEKSSDREDLDGDGETDTYWGDTVTYDITITNNIPVYTENDTYKDIYNTMNTWRDVKLSDPLADHVTFIDGSVKISYDSGVTWITAVQGAGYNQYTYEAAVGSNGTLNVYLKDMAPEDEVKVIFQVIAKKEAVGRSIRNKGTVEGVLANYEGGSYVDYEYKTDFDDKNDDPVKDAYIVSYDGNGGAKPDGSTEKNYPYPVSSTTPPSHTVQDNNHADLGFVQLGHTFAGWNTQEDGSGTSYTGDGGEVLTVTEDITLYAQWEAIHGSITIHKEGDNGEELEHAKFLLERKTNTGTWEKIKWDGSAWAVLSSGETYSGETDGDGTLVFGKSGSSSVLPAGIYRITETWAPEGYSLLKDSLEVTIPYETKTAPSGSSVPQESYEDDEGDTVYRYYDLTYTITDVAAFKLPDAGGKDMPMNLFFIIGLLMTITTGGVYGYRRRAAKLKMSRQ